MGHFVPDLAHSTDTLKQLLRKNVARQRLPDQEIAFKATNDILKAKLVLRPFNPNYNTDLITDASRVGLGFALLHVNPLTGYRHLIQCSSRSLSGPETRYAVFELEGLAILYVIMKCKHYLLRMDHFTVVTNHKPLKGVFAKELPEIENTRLCRYRERLTGYNFELSWWEGKTNLIPDCTLKGSCFFSQ